MKSCSLHTHESKLIFDKNIDNCMCMSDSVSLLHGMVVTK